MTIINTQKMSTVIGRLPKPVRKLLKGAYRKYRAINKVLYKHFLFRHELKKFRNLSKHNERFELHDADLYPCIKDNTSLTGFDAHYIYHPAWATRILSVNRPAEHVDISSTLYFCSVLSAFIPVKFYDYRPVKLNLSNLECLRTDLLKLPFEDDSIASLSCMHTLEHVGLGRYGDELDPDGDLKAIAELKRVTAKAGTLLIAVPVSGQPRIQFNAHRIYSFEQILEYFSGFKLVQFDLIPDNAGKVGMVFNASEADANKQHYGCGCFYFRKSSI